MENMNLSDKSKEALQSETWTELREDLKKEIVKEYLKAGYADEEKQNDVEVSGKTYKVLERGEVTTFYDNLGNTLFSVENKELAAKYDELMKTGDKPDPVDEKENNGDAEECPVVDKKQDEKPDNQPQPKYTSGGEKIKSQIEMQMKKNKGGHTKFMLQQVQPIIDYITERCEQDKEYEALVLADHKSWERCFEYTFKKAQNMAEKGARGLCVFGDTMIKWIDEYFAKDDKKEVEEKAKREAEAKARREKAAAKKKDKTNDKSAKKEKPKEQPKEQPKPKKNGKEMEGQLDMFSMMGM